MGDTNTERGKHHPSPHLHLPNDFQKLPQTPLGELWVSPGSGLGFELLFRAARDQTKKADESPPLPLPHTSPPPSWAGKKDGIGAGVRPSWWRELKNSRTALRAGRLGVVSPDKATVYVVNCIINPASPNPQGHLPHKHILFSFNGGNICIQQKAPKCTFGWMNFGKCIHVCDPQPPLEYSAFSSAQNVPSCPLPTDACPPTHSSKPMVLVSLTVSV